MTHDEVMNIVKAARAKGERADLCGANLRGADLCGANLRGADLCGANLRGADLCWADLCLANLRGADLCWANLRGANLSGADLSGADLCLANLRGADLSEAKLRGADLSEAKLSAIKLDFYTILDAAPNEVPALLAKIRAGEVDGSCYEGACSCLLGTLGTARGCRYDQLGIAPDNNRPAERWFLAIRPGHTPENHPVAKITADWIEEWEASRRLKGGQ